MDDYLQRIYKVFGNEYSVLEEYNNQNQKILVKHNICGKEYRTNAGNLMVGHGCGECYKKNKLGKARRLDNETIETFISNREKGNFKLLDIYYKNGEARIKTYHSICKTESDMTYQNFKNSCGCSCCAEIQRRKNHTKNTDEFKKQINELHGDEYSVLNEYRGVWIKIDFRHNRCGTAFSVTPAYALRERESPLCPKCGKDQRSQEKSMTTKEFKEKVHDVWGDEYEVLTEYKRSQLKVKIKHNICGNIYRVVPASLLIGCGCPKCCNFDSKACKRIEKFLQENSFDYAREFKIKGCKYKYRLPFDFAVLEKGKIKLLIEYDGEQHFEPVKFFGGEEDFTLRMKRDNIKNEYCLNNNIKLLRISYMQDDLIEQILQKELL
jgi:hypothetical protein